MKNVLVLFEFPNLTVGQYEKTWDDLRAAGHTAPEGLIHHIGAQSGNGIAVADVWESETAFKDFGAVLMPILKKNGFPDVQPRILPVAYRFESKEKHEFAAP